MRNAPIYHPELAQTPFYLGRHGESDGNAGNLSQGRGEDALGNPNDLTPIGIAQVKASVRALAAAGIMVRYVSSSSLTRAVESADTFMDTSVEPKPTWRGTVALDQEDGLKEVSQKGWEGVYKREETKQRRAQKLASLVGQLASTGKLEQEAVDGYSAWVMRLGEGENEGESPLQAALRGILALEQHDIRPGELIFSHAMLNRYMDAIATGVGGDDREQLRQLLDDRSTLGHVAVISALRELGIKDFKTHDSAANRQANGGVTEYTIDLQTGLWAAGRCIEPPQPNGAYLYTEHRRNHETGKWERVTPDGGNIDNE